MSTGSGSDVGGLSGMALDGRLTRQWTSVARSTLCFMPDDQQDQLHMNGPMIAGGAGYSLHELTNLADPIAHSTGLHELDEMCGGGLHTGEVWTIAGQSRSGTTLLATHIAVAASPTADVLFANGHVSTQLLRDRVLGMAVATDSVKSVRSRLRIASWEPVPRWVPEEHHDAGSDGQAVHAVDIFDTLDEMWMPDDWPPTAEARLTSVRSLRESARWQDRATVLVARVEPGPDFDVAWQRHWACSVFADVGDVQLEIRRTREQRTLHIYRRGSAQRGFRLERVGLASRLSLRSLPG